MYLQLANRTSKRLSFVLGMSILAAVLAALYFVGERGVGLTIGLFVVAGIGMSSIYFCPWAMLPDTVEYSQWKLGVRREGILFGTFFLSQQLGSAVALFLQGMGLHLAGYVANAEQSARSLAGIRLLMSLVPLAFVVAGIAAHRVLPDHGRAAPADGAGDLRFGRRAAGRGAYFGSFPSSFQTQRWKRWKLATGSANIRMQSPLTTDKPFWRASSRAPTDWQPCWIHRWRMPASAASRTTLSVWAELVSTRAPSGLSVMSVSRWKQRSPSRESAWGLTGHQAVALLLQLPVGQVAEVLARAGHPDHGQVLAGQKLPDGFPRVHVNFLLISRVHEPMRSQSRESPGVAPMTSITNSMCRNGSLP